jgi:hypothetical protein
MVLSARKFKWKTAQGGFSSRSARAVAALQNKIRSLYVKDTGDDASRCGGLRPSAVMTIADPVTLVLTLVSDLCVVRHQRWFLQFDQLPCTNFRMAEQQQSQEPLLQPQRQQQLQQTPGLHGVAAEALKLLEQELDSQLPSVSNASLVLGVLQERLFGGQDEGQPLAAAAAQLAEKFQQQLVAPAAAKLGPKCKLTQVRHQWRPSTHVSQPCG